MVAYSFQKQFVGPIEGGEKRQTIRAPRKRHARVGEPIQIYTAMRTKGCRKLIDPDPVCIRSTRLQILFADDADRHGPERIRFQNESASGWCELIGAEPIEQFAFEDGFRADDERTARAAMGAFWLATYGQDVPPDAVLRFDGHLIEWATAEEAAKRLALGLSTGWVPPEMEAIGVGR